MKSQVKCLVGLAEAILRDCAARCSANELDDRDLMTLKSRIKHEGLSFLTLTLPTLGADLERGLATGGLDSTFFRSFKKNGTIPAFMQGMFNRVFDKATGGILDEPDVACIESIRQLSYAFKKLRVPCADHRTRLALTKFVETETNLEKDIAPEDTSDFLDVSRMLWPSVIHHSFMLDVHAFVPKHGPGATAEKRAGNSKYVTKRWHDRLEPYFPLLANGFHNWNVTLQKSGLKDVTVIPTDAEQPVRVITVPKTLKGPRVIAIEPVCMQYAQQAIKERLYKALEMSQVTKGHVNLTCQETNRELALEASRDGRHATIDLSSASDLVDFNLAIRMFDSHPDLQGAIRACRSTRAMLPDGKVITLRKFASMGSALCFPVEAMYFYTICIVALLKKHDLPVTFRNCYRVSRDVYVFGDDIIVPTDTAEVVSDYLQRYNCKVNTSKSFASGKFRESCGMDAFDGVEVTPTYIREVPPRDKQSAKQIISWVKTANHFYLKGLWYAAQYMRNHVESILGVLPIVGDDCAGLGWRSVLRRVSTQRWNRKLQRHEVLTWQQQPVFYKDQLNGYAALLKCLLRLDAKDPQSFSTDNKKKPHLKWTARHGAVTLKRRWVLPY